MLVNLKLMGNSNPGTNPDLTRAEKLLSKTVSTSHGCADSRANYPVFGEDAFRTATGVHAAAVIKA